MFPVNRHRWFFTWSKFNETSRALDVIDGNGGGQHKTLYISNDGGNTPKSEPVDGPDALPADVIINEWYPNSLYYLLKRHNIRVTDESVAKLPPLAADDVFVKKTQSLYPNFPVDEKLHIEGRREDSYVDAYHYLNK
jgi:hypothetical protein